MDLNGFALNAMSGGHLFLLDYARSRCVEQVGQNTFGFP